MAATSGPNHEFRGESPCTVDIHHGRWQRQESSVKLLGKVANIFDRTIEYLAIVAAALIILMMLNVGVGVFLRYFLGRPTGWVIDISEWSLVYITFLATAWLLREEGHVKMDILLTRLGPRVQVWLGIITSIIGAIGCFLIAWYGAKVTWGLFQVGYSTAAVLIMPKFIILGVIPVGGFFLFIQFLRRTYGYLVRLKVSANKQ